MIKKSPCSARLIVYFESTHWMHIFIEHDKNVNFFRKHIPGIYQVYTRFGNDKGIYLVYTWYIPGKTFQGVLDVHILHIGTKDNKVAYFAYKIAYFAYYLHIILHILHINIDCILCILCILFSIFYILFYKLFSIFCI